jgi:hypothetical protein
VSGLLIATYPSPAQNLNPTNASWWIVHLSLKEAAIEKSTN